MIIWKRCLTARNRTLYRGEIAFPFGGNRVKEIFCWHYHLVADNHFHNGDYVRLRPFLLMEWYLSRMSRTRSFYSFYCSTDGFTALIVSSRKPIEWLSTPFSTHSIVRLCPFYLYKRQNTPVEWVERGHSTDILLILFKKHTQSNESNEVCMSFRYWDRGGRLVADRQVPAVSIMVLRHPSTKEAPHPSPCIPHPPPLERSYGEATAELRRR